MNPNRSWIPQVVDYGAQPLVVNLDCFVKANPYFRAVLWTGEHLQVTLMNIPAGGEIGVEQHMDLDQFLKIEDGCALVMMGQYKNALNIQKKATSRDAVFVPAGTWHNILNIGHIPLKLYSVYAPPQHPFGTIHRTKAEAEVSERD